MHTLGDNQAWSLTYHRRINLRGFFPGRAKIRGRKIWNWSLEMKEKCGIRSLAVASWWMAAISLWALDGCCYLLVASGWLLLFPGGLWMVAVISWWPLDGCCYFLVASGWLLFFPGGLWMAAAIS